MVLRVRIIKSTPYHMLSIVKSICRIIADLIFSGFSNQLLTILCTSKGHPTSFHATQILFCVLNDIFLAIPRSSFIIIDFFYYNFTASALPFHSSSLFLSLSLVLPSFFLSPRHYCYYYTSTSCSSLYHI